MSHNPGKIQRAILSVTDKTGLVEFARKLSGLGVELISTGGTAKLLRDSGIAVKDISELTGFPEMLDGRVKTLHPKVHGGILHRRENPAHRTAVAEHGILPIDMVVVNLYAFEKTAAKPDVHFDELIENIDIGGPSMIRSAAKNFQDVAVVTSPADYDQIAEEMAKSGGELSSTTRWRLAQKAFATTAAYDSAIASTLERVSANGHFEFHDEAGFPQTLRLSFSKVMDLRYGENPHQKAAMYSDGSGTGRGQWTPDSRQGAFLQQHRGSGSGLGSGPGIRRAGVRDYQTHQPRAEPRPARLLLEAYKKALECDPVSAFGGVIGVNRPVDGDAAEEMAKLFLEVIAAPSFDEAAKAKFASKKNLRLVEINDARQKWVLKNVSGGILVQDADVRPLAESDLKVVSKRPPTAGRKTGSAVRLEGLQAREVERDCLCPRRTDGRRRRRTDEPRGFLQDRRHEGGAAAEGNGRRLGRFFPVPRRSGRNRQGRRHCNYPAGRIGARPGGNRSRRPPGLGHDLHRSKAFPALKGSI